MQSPATPQQQQCTGCQGHVVCRCLGISEETLLTALAANPVRTIKELKAITGAGDGCTCCHSVLQSYIERFSANERTDNLCQGEAVGRKELTLTALAG